MPYTTPHPPQRLTALTALLRAGLASDDQLLEVGVALGPTRAVRLLADTGNTGCSGPSDAGPVLVALDPDDAALPDDQRLAVSGLTRGRAIADHAWAALRGGTIALPGCDVVITRTASLSDCERPGPLLLTLADLAAGLAATALAHAPRVWTLAIVDDVSRSAVPDGWSVVTTSSDGIGAQTGLGLIACGAAA